MSVHRHTWKRYGGLKENPGVHSSGGSVVIATRCTCGAERREDWWDHRTNRPRKTAKVTITPAVK